MLKISHVIFISVSCFDLGGTINPHPV